jgi:hypothetical protein
VLLAGEATFGTVPNPAASQALEFISVSTGKTELGQVRPKKDRNPGRAMSDGFIVGRVQPMPWSLETSVKSRAAVDTVPNETALMKGAGLTQTVNVSTSVVYTLSGAPVQDSSLATISLYRALGIGTGATSSRYAAEQLRGGVVKTLQWTGGDRELTLKASGDAIGKYHLGYHDSVTLADGSGTTLDLGTTEKAYRFGIGWYQIESEVIFISAINYATHIATIARGQLSTSGAAHSAKPMVPYLPSGLSYPGSPISEVNASVVLDSQTIRFTSFDITLTTGIELGPGETGSKYVQTPIVKRYSCKISLKGMLRRDDGMSLLGKVEQQATPLACTIACGTGTGGIVTFSFPYTEVEAFELPDNGNDEVMVTVPLRLRDSTTGNDLMSITYT